MIDLYKAIYKNMFYLNIDKNIYVGKDYFSHSFDNLINFNHGGYLYKLYLLNDPMYHSAHYIPLDQFLRNHIKCTK